VICFGCAGAYPGSGLKIGDLVVASEECYGDEGAQTSAGFLDMQDLGFPLAEAGADRWFNRFPVDPELCGHAQRLLAIEGDAGHRVTVGPLVTVSTCAGSTALGEELVRRTGGLAENMEGAAVAQLCARFGVPFLEIRGISNLVEERDLSRWDLPLATAVAQHAVRSVLAGWSDRQEPA
jgi:futalosine hydrolase